MKKFLALISMFILLGSGCSKTGVVGYESEITGEKTRDCSTLEPDNPYSSGSGHYAGFEWAEKNEPSLCGGRSNSFIEGCEEYLEQLDDYSNCLKY